MPGDLLLRPHFEAGPSGVGLGHVARCVALGQAWTHHGGTARLVAQDLPDVWSARCRAARIQVVDSPLVTAVPEAPLGRRWVVLDGYRTSLDEQRVVRAHGARLLVIDDHGSIGHYDADLILDQNLAADPSCYPASIPTVLGASFALLRREFTTVERSRPGDSPRVVVAPGGQPSPAVGAFFDAVATELRGAGVTVVDLGGPDDVAAQLASADVALAAAGTTAYELCAVGTPAVLVAVAANQEPVAARLAAAGAAVSVGPLNGLDTDFVVDTITELLANRFRRSQLATAGSALVDGHGAARVVAHMRSQYIDLRPAGPDDCEQVWCWSNDPDTRRNSFSPEPIPWDDHQRWFAGQLADPDRLLLMADVEHRELGQIRFDLPAEGADPTESAVVSFSLMPSARGVGWGAPLLIAGARLLRDCRPGLAIDGHVKPDNVGSIASFERAGFARSSADGDETVTFRLEHP